ncbi:hypothetical protein PVAND_014321 [Polypedilum vanderplanki]|uniref:Uncharacterized protein n=1 Tax=Polypedilum vanderplanki TaxID=319348 RepID=A0A9J6CSR3_POLVA|nr:hypothetical protein PVAND_014321 [Polypedilum vanderplanki]
MSSQEQVTRLPSKNNILDYFGTSSPSNYQRNSKIDLGVKKHGGKNKRDFHKKSKDAQSRKFLFSDTSSQNLNDNSNTLIDHDKIFAPLLHQSVDITEINAPCSAMIQKCKPLENKASLDTMRKQSNELLEIIKEQNGVINKLISGVVVNNTELNRMVNRSNEISDVVEGLRKSSNVHSDQIEHIKISNEQIHEKNILLSTRVEKLETIQEAKAMSSKLNLIPLCRVSGIRVDAFGNPQGIQNYFSGVKNDDNEIQTRSGRKKDDNVIAVPLELILNVEESGVNGTDRYVIGENEQIIVASLASNSSYCLDESLIIAILIFWLIFQTLIIFGCCIMVQRHVTWADAHHQHQYQYQTRDGGYFQ